MPDVEIRYVERTSLYGKPLMEVIKKHTKKIKHDIRIVFDLRIKDYGSHFWDEEKDLHIIRISPLKCKFHCNEDNPQGIRLGPVAEKYRIISAILHEIRHAQQKEELGYSKFYQEKYGSVKTITNPHVAIWYSECERDARMYEDKLIEEAIKIYDSYCNE